MTIEELGAALRVEREKRGLTIEDAANHLKIGVRLLRALEAGDAGALPHPAYAKGFIRSYSSYLGLAPDEVAEAMLSLSGAEAPTVPQPVYAVDEDSSHHGSYKWLLYLILLAALGGGLYFAWQQGALDSLSSQTRRLAMPSPSLQAPDPSARGQNDVQGAAKPRFGADASSRAPAPTPAAAPVASSAPAASGQRSSQPGQTAPVPVNSASAPALPSTAPVAGTSAPAGQLFGKTSGQTFGQTAGQPSGQTTQVQGLGTTQAPGPVTADGAGQGALPAGLHKVIITATEECWIHSNADNTDTRQFSLRKGDTFALTFGKKLELKLGNAGGVRLRYNGEEVPTLGKPGQVRTLVFPQSQPVAQP